MAGGTTGTPINPPSIPDSGATIALATTRPLPYTWLTLDRYSRMIPGLSPIHFFGALAPNASPTVNNCRQVVPRHGWQYFGETSREEILIKIREAEMEIAKHVGFNLAPDYTVEEQREYTSDYYRDRIGNVEGLYGLKDIELKRGKVILPGKWNPTLVSTATVANSGITFYDYDSDGFYEAVRVTATTTQTDPRKMGVFFTGGSGAPEWQIRYPYAAGISGGTYTAYFHSWLFLDPDKDAAFPGSDYNGIDIETDTSNFVSSVDVYDISTDTTVEHVRINWGRYDAVSAQDFYYATGTFFIRDAEAGIVVPSPATYDADTGVWTPGSFTYGQPTTVTVSYYSGNQSDEYLARRSMDPLSHLYARAIAEMATARLDRPPCSCPETVKYHQDISIDLTMSTSEMSRFTVKDIEASKFGTRAGEVQAWRLINGPMKGEHRVGYAVL